jgi:hypothetical protein
MDRTPKTHHTTIVEIIAPVLAGVKRISAFRDSYYKVPSPSAPAYEQWGANKSAKGPELVEGPRPGRMSRADGPFDKLRALASTRNNPN